MSNRARQGFSRGSRGKRVTRSRGDCGANAIDWSRDPASATTGQLRCPDELALELRISWDHSTDEIWREFDPEVWELTRNPTLELHAASETKLNELAADSKYRRRIEDFDLACRLYARSPGWFQFALAVLNEPLQSAPFRRR
jgi:hypothetical protein